MLILGKNDNTSKYFRPHKNEKYTLNKQNIEKDFKDLLSKSLHMENRKKDIFLKLFFKINFLQ